MFSFFRRFFPNRHTYPLNPNQPTIILPVIFTNKGIILETNLALDTGASFTVIRPEIANILNLKPNQSYPLEIATASGFITAAQVTIPETEFLGHNLYHTSAIIADLPDEAPIDGLLGLNHLNNFKLTLDFPNHRLTLR